MLGAEALSTAAEIAHRSRINGVIRSIGLNTAYQIGSQVAPAVAAIAAIPFLLRHLGYDVFGIITILATTLAYFTMLDLGLGRAATRFISQNLEIGSPDDVRRYFWGSIILLSGIGVVVTISCVLSVPTVVGYLKIPTAYSRSATESFYIICLTIPIVTLMATLRGFLEACGRFPFVSIVTGCGGVGDLRPSSPRGLYGWRPCCGCRHVCRGQNGDMRSSSPSVVSISKAARSSPDLRMAAVRRMLSFGGWLSVSNIVGTATIYCDRFLLGMWVGMAAVTSYGMPLDLLAGCNS